MFNNHYTLEAQGHAGYRDCTHEGASLCSCSLPGMTKRGRALHHRNVRLGSGVETLQSRGYASAPVLCLLHRHVHLPRRCPRARTGRVLSLSPSSPVASLDLHGANALVQDLVRDRVARRGITPTNAREAVDQVPRLKCTLSLLCPSSANTSGSSQGAVQ